MVIIARYLAGEAMIDEVAAHTVELAAASRSEPGCLEYLVLRSDDTPGELTLIERYADGEAFEAHINSTHYKEIGKGRIHPLLESREVVRYEVVGP